MLSHCSSHSLKWSGLAPSLKTGASHCPHRRPRPDALHTLKMSTRFHSGYSLMAFGHAGSLTVSASLYLPWPLPSSSATSSPSPPPPSGGGPPSSPPPRPAGWRGPPPGGGPSPSSGPLGGRPPPPSRGSPRRPPPPPPPSPASPPSKNDKKGFLRLFLRPLGKDLQPKYFFIEFLKVPFTKVL